MQQILNFVIRNKTFLLFLFLFSIAISITIQSHSYHRSKFINSANFLSGAVYGIKNSIDRYFNLEQKNEVLADENKKLREQLFNAETNTNIRQINTFDLKGNYKVTVAEVYKNAYALTNNYLMKLYQLEKAYGKFDLNTLLTDINYWRC